MALLARRLVLLIILCAIFLTLTLSYLILSLTTPTTSPSSINFSDEPCARSFTEELNITWHKDNTSLAPDTLPRGHGHAEGDGAVIVPFLLGLGRGSTWRSVLNVTLQGDTHEPEGMLFLPPDRIVVSSAEYTVPTQPFPGGKPINGTDRTPGEGFAHLQTYSFPEGDFIADVTVSQEGSWEYHNGGIDYDGEHIWGVLGQRRPGSSGTVYQYNPKTGEGHGVVGFETDHLGTIVFGGKGRAVGMSWGSRKGYVFDTSNRDNCVVQHPEGIDNPSHFIDYQDCKFMGLHEGKSLALCSGVAKVDGGSFTLGGLALVDIDTMRPVWELPIDLKSGRGTRITMNPFDVTVGKDGVVRFWWAPDQHQTVVYGFEVNP